MTGGGRGRCHETATHQGQRSHRKGRGTGRRRAYYGYPITPASEIAEAAALYFPQAGGVFLQAESEVASINMIYGGAAAGVRSMSASSGPGISLMQEGLSYLAGAELPCVVADIMRGGPGLGNIAPEQGDYNQVVKGGGHGNYRTLVLAPEFRAGDGRPHRPGLRPGRRVPQPGHRARGWLHRPDDGAGRIRRAAPVPPPPAWAVTGHGGDRPNLMTSLYLEPDLHGGARPQTGSEVQRSRAQGNARRVLAHGGRRNRAGRLRHRRPHPEGGGGDWAAREASALGLLRPITLFPFPAEHSRAGRRARLRWWWN